MNMKKELTALRNEVETPNKKLAELTSKELKKVAGGMDLDIDLPGLPVNPFEGIEADPANPGKSTFHFLPDEDVHYDQIILENLYEIINQEIR